MARLILPQGFHGHDFINFEVTRIEPLPQVC